MRGLYAHASQAVGEAGLVGAEQAPRELDSGWTQATGPWHEGRGYSSDSSSGSHFTQSRMPARHAGILSSATLRSDVAAVETPRSRSTSLFRRSALGLNR